MIILTPLMKNRFVRGALDKLCPADGRSLLYVSELKWRPGDIVYLPSALIFYGINYSEIWRAARERAARKSNQEIAPLGLTILLSLKNLQVTAKIISLLKHNDVVFLPTSEPYIESIMLRLISRSYNKPCVNYTPREYMGFVSEPMEFLPTLIDIENIRTNLQKPPGELSSATEGYSTGGDLATFFSSVKNHSSERNLSRAIVVFLHDLLDAPGIFGRGNYENLMDWMVDTITILKESGAEFYIKPHPNQIKSSSIILNRFVKKHDISKHLINLPSQEILDLRPKLIVTNHGSISLEAAAAGVPILIAGEALVTLAGITKKITGQLEYRNHLRSAIPMTIDTNRALHLRQIIKTSEYKWKIEKPILFDYSILNFHRNLKTNEDLMDFCSTDLEFITKQAASLDVHDKKIFEHALQDALRRTKNPKIAIILTEEFTYEYYIEELLTNTDSDFIVLGNFKEKSQLIKYNKNNIILFKDIDIERTKKGLKNIKTIFRIRQILKLYGVKKVITLMPKANLLGQIASSTTGVDNSYVILTGNIWLDHKGISRWFLYHLEKFIVHLSTVVVADSQSQHEILICHYPKSKNKIRYVNGLNARDFEVDLQKPNKDQKVITVGHFGRLHPRKGTQDAIKVAETCLQDGCPVNFRFAGPIEHRPLRSQIERLVNLYPSKVFFEEGFFDFRTQVDKIDILLMPSSYEGFGIAAVEAAKLATIIIGYDVVGLKDSILENETGHRVVPNDVDALVKLVKFYSNNRVEMRSLQKKSSDVSRKKFSSSLLLTNLKSELDL